MRRYYVLLALLGLGAIVVLVGKGGPRSLARQEQAPQPAVLPDPPSSNQYQGVASCASTACHHFNGPKGSKGSEYTTWMAHDPHARAYTVLFDKRSLNIEKNLNPSKDVRPHQDQLCLNCHVLPDVNKVTKHERFSLADGVGCENCHGAAEKWLSEHYGQRKSRAELRELGMIDTKNVRVRAEVCVTCHVGERENDVNHDLIAAGHPRLRFEYAAYLANYTSRHWKVENDHKDKPDFEARAWLVGQVVSARAATKLLQYRADKTKGKPWPEFAEYGCFECHHDLSDPSWRQKRRSSGTLAWGTWCFPMMKTVAGQAGTEVPKDLNDLRDAMGKKYPDRKEAADKAKKVSDALDQWSKNLDNKKLDAKSVTFLLAALAEDKEEKLSEQNWDNAAQLYLAIAAMHNALGDLDPKYKQNSSFKPTVRHLGDTLRSAFLNPPSMQYDSPHNFKPELLQQDLLRLREQIQRRGDK
jgi:hypothetical protein